MRNLLVYILVSSTDFLDFGTMSSSDRSSGTVASLRGEGLALKKSLIDICFLVILNKKLGHGCPLGGVGNSSVRNFSPS
jgi:hypothetical protein